MDLGLQAVESGDDGGDMAQERRVVETGVEVGQAEVGGDRRIEGEQLAKRLTLVGRPQRRSLDDSVGLLSRQPATLYEGDEDAAAGVQAEPALDVLPHPLTPNHQT